MEELSIGTIVKEWWNLCRTLVLVMCWMFIVKDWWLILGILSLILNSQNCRFITYRILNLIEMSFLVCICSWFFMIMVLHRFIWIYLTFLLVIPSYLICSMRLLGELETGTSHFAPLNSLLVPDSIQGVFAFMKTCTGAFFICDVPYKTKVQQFCQCCTLWMLLFVY